MRLVRTEISAQFNSPALVIERSDSNFKSPFHFHPEIELVYIVEGSGKRIVGDRIENFSEGEIVLIGSNLPHLWISDEKANGSISNKKARSIVAYFDREIFGKAFYELKEADGINKLLDAATRGVKIIGNTQTRVAAKMKKLIYKEGLTRILYLIEILHSISSSGEIEYINNETYSGYMQKSESDRLNQICKYVNANFKNNIKLKDVADIAHLTTQSFCRFFKTRMSKNFIDYLHEVRISYACRYLIETDKTISEIAYNTGFKTVPNFNKHFKHKTGFCPTEYRHNTTGNVQPHS
jgi:AraC-like DNA-binding protein